MRIAYFTNQYPKISHTFIRREIAALENGRSRVTRFALKRSGESLVDALDREELARTKYILDLGIFSLIRSVIEQIVQHPKASLQAFVNTLKIGWRSDRGLLRHVVYFVEACTLAKWCRERDIDHLHAHFGTNPAAVAMLASLMGGAPYSFTIHGPEEFDKPDFLALKEKTRHAAFVVTVSSFGKSQLMRWADFRDWEKINVVHCGLDFAAENETPTPVPDTPRLVCVGRLCEQKGQLLLIEAADIIRQKGWALDLVLVGDGPLRAEIEAKIAARGLGEHVRITGWVNERRVKAEILAARAFVLPSFAEGLPVAIMEAMAKGRPVISTYIAGIPELISPGTNGWLVPAGDVDALAGAMEGVLEQPTADLQKIGDAALARVRERHNIEVEAGKLRKLMETMHS